MNEYNSNNKKHGFWKYKSIAYKSRYYYRINNYNNGKIMGYEELYYVNKNTTYNVRY